MLAQRVLDQRRLVGVAGAEDATEPLGLGRDAALGAGPLERGLQLYAGQSRGPGRSRGRLQQLPGLRPAQAVAPGFEGRPGGRVVLPQQRAELVGQLLPVPQRVLLSTGENSDGPGRAAVIGQRPVGVHVVRRMFARTRASPGPDFLRETECRSR